MHFHNPPTAYHTIRSVDPSSSAFLARNHRPQLPFVWQWQINDKAKIRGHPSKSKGRRIRRRPRRAFYEVTRRSIKIYFLANSCGGSFGMQDLISFFHCPRYPATIPTKWKVWNLRGIFFSLVSESPQGFKEESWLLLLPPLKEELPASLLLRKRCCTASTEAHFFINIIWRRVPVRIHQEDSRFDVMATAASGNKKVFFRL